MKALVILVILAILFFAIASSSLASVDLTPYSGADTSTNFSTPNLNSDTLDTSNVVVIQNSNAYPQTVPNQFVPVTGSCSDPYTVQSGDILSGIAVLCNTSIATIRAANPEISNANLIYPGQLLRIPGATQANTLPQQPAPTAIPLPVSGAQPAPGTELMINPTPAQQAAAPGLSPFPVIQAGVGLRIRAINYPANMPVTVAIGPQLGQQNVIATGMTDSSGSLVFETVVPPAPDSVTAWIVVVRTTMLPDVQAASQPFYIETLR